MASEFGRRAFSFYRGLGYSPPQAAALAGNAMAESGGSTSIVGDQGKALGIFQWHPDRQARLLDYAKSQGLDPRSEQAQLGFFDWELKNTERRAGEMLRSAQTPEEAQAAVLASLRPQGFRMSDPTQSHNYGGRLKNTLSLLGAEAGGGVTPMDPSALTAGQTTPTVANAASTTTPMQSAMKKEGGLLGGLDEAYSALGSLMMEQQMQQRLQQEQMRRLGEMDMGPGVSRGRFVPLTGFRGLI